LGIVSVRSFLLGRFHLGHNAYDFTDEFGFPYRSSPREFLFPLALGRFWRAQRFGSVDRSCGNVCGAISWCVGQVSPLQEWAPVARSWSGSGICCYADARALVYSKLRNFSQTDSLPKLPGPGSYFGNNQDSWHWGPHGYHPSDNEDEWREYQQLGQIAYTQEKFHEALAFINSHRSLYAQQTLRRGVYLWTGFWSLSPRYLQEEPADPLNMVFSTGLTILTLIGLRRAWLMNRTVAMPYMVVFLLFPVIYYVTHPEDYYRRPIDPQYAMLAAHAVASWVAEWKQELSTLPSKVAVAIGE